MSAAVHLHILAALMVGSAHLAGAAAWTGYVFDGESRLPLEDALVRAASGRSATTDAQGRYLIQDPPTSVDGPSIAGWDRAGGSLFLELPHREALRLEVLDLSGRLLSRPFDGDAGPGRWSWSVSSLGAMTDPVVVRLVHAGSRHTWTILPGMGIGARTETQGGIPARSAGTESDTFRISLAGYDSALVLAEAASSTVDTTWLSPRTAPGGIPWNATIAYGTLLDTRDKQTYRTVRIGSQNWMAQNLNFKPASPDSGTCLGAKADSCTKYGRMYDWKTAMAGAVASRYLPRAVQGLCPAGWHLPTQGEWEELANSVGTDPKHTRNLKSVSGWPPLANGSDAHGFRALPAGMVVGRTGGMTGTSAYWWTSSAGSPDSAVIGVGMDRSLTAFSSIQPEIGYSLRCVEGAVGTPKDTLLSSLILSDGRGRRLAPVFDPRILTYHDTVPWTFASVKVEARALDTTTATVWIQGTKTNSASVPLGSNGSTTLIRIVVRAPDGDSLRYQVSVHRPEEPPTFGIPWKTGPSYGTLYDVRDGHVYRTVSINAMTWMAQNLDYRIPGSDSGACLSNSLDSCAKYGRLYTWSNAMGSSNTSNAVPSGVQGVCPNGWHLPSEAEWSKLETIEGSYIPAYRYKSTTGWSTGLNNGTDSYGFRALPAGEIFNSGNLNRGTHAYWWTTTESSPTDPDYAIGRWINDGTNPIPTSSILRTLHLSVRCVKN